VIIIKEEFKSTAGEPSNYRRAIIFGAIRDTLVL